MSYFVTTPRGKYFCPIYILTLQVQNLGLGLTCMPWSLQGSAGTQLIPDDLVQVSCSVKLIHLEFILPISSYSSLSRHRQELTDSKLFSHSANTGLEHPWSEGKVTE